MRHRTWAWSLVGLAAACGGAAVPAARPPASVPVAAAEPSPEPEEMVLPEVAPRDVALHLDRPDGPVIGRLLAGARLVAEDRHDPFVQVALGGVYRPVPLSGGITALPLSAWIDTRELAEPAAPVVDTTVREVRDFGTLMQLTPDGGGFAWTTCGPLRIVEERRDAQGELAATRIAQTFDGYELVGWTESPLSRRRGDHRCPPEVIAAVQGYVLMPGQTVPVPDPLPAGFVEAHMVPASRVTAMARARSEIYWIEETDAGAVCQPWRLAVRRGATALEHDESQPSGWRGRASYEVYVSDGGVVLLGPTVHWIRQPRGQLQVGDLSFACGSEYAMVEANAERIVLLPGQHNGGVRGYRPEQTESWFLSRDACEAAVQRAPSVDEALALAHKGC